MEIFVSIAGKEATKNIVLLVGQKDIGNRFLEKKLDYAYNVILVSPGRVQFGKRNIALLGVGSKDGQDHTM